MQQNLVNKYIFTNWKHNSGSEFKWLRRINRQTSTQFISDCQRSLHTDSKGNIIEKNGEYFKSSLKSCSTRFKINKSNKLIEIRGRRANRDGVNIVTIVEDFNTLDCDYSYDTFLQETEKYKDDRFKVHVLNFEKKGQIWHDSVAIALNKIFGNDIDIKFILDSGGNLNIIQEDHLLAKSAIFHHITLNGEDSNIISSKSDQGNVTISFWKFGKIVVYKQEVGIGTW